MFSISKFLLVLGNVAAFSIVSFVAYTEDSFFNIISLNLHYIGLKLIGLKLG